MKMYADYIKERANQELIATDKGFVTYELGQDYCYIVDVYVLPEFRKSHVAIELGDKVVDLAKKNGINKIIGSVSLLANGRDTSIQGLYAWGMKISHYDKDTIYFVKEV